MAVASPYQTLLVGDPLTTPFAEPATLSLLKPDQAKIWQGKVDLEVDYRAKNGQPPDHYELWVDGVPVAEAAVDEVLAWDTSLVADGYHELHLVGVEAPPREGRLSRRYWVQTNNQGLQAFLKAETPVTRYGTPFMLSGTAPQGSQIRVTAGKRKLLETSAAEGTWEAILPTTLLGLGEVTLQAIATLPSEQQVFSNPLLLKIEPGHNLPGLPDAPKGDKGLMVNLSYLDPQGKIQRKKKQVKALNGKLHKLLPKNSKLIYADIAGYFQAKSSGFHQLSIRTRGVIHIAIDDQQYSQQASPGDYGMIYLPLFLEKGWHWIHLQPAPEGFSRLQVILAGETPPTVLNDRITRSRTP